MVFSLDHAPVLSSPPQVHIKVRLLKETLRKYILKLSVTSLSCHQLDEEEEEEFLTALQKNKKEPALI